MECKHHYKRKQKIAGIGGDLVENEEHFCALKETDTLTKYKVYDALFKKGLQGSFLQTIAQWLSLINGKNVPFMRRKINNENTK